MVNLIRRFQRPLLTVLVIVVIIAFVYLFNVPSGKSGISHPDAVARIYGHNVTQLEVQKEGYRFAVCTEMQLTEMLFLLAGREAAFAAMFGQAPTEAAADNYIWNTLVLRHEADELGIIATDAEKLEAIKKVPRFQTNGAFNPIAYQEFVRNRLPHRGLSADDLEVVAADQIRLDKVRTLLSSTVEPSPAEVREQYVEHNQKTEASFVRFKLEDFKAGVKVTDEDVAKLFEERKGTLKTPEKRKVKFVGFTLAAEQKPLQGPERAEKTRELAERAQNFALSTAGKDADFDAAAAKLGLKVEETPLFAQDDPPAELGKTEAAAEAAFHLTKEEPNSDVISAQNGYYVLHLAGIEEARPLTLEEAKPKLTEQLTQERAQEAMNLKAAEARAKIDAEIKAGKTFEQAAEAAGVKVEKLPAFAAADQNRQEPPETAAIKGRAAELKEGELSEFVPIAAGGVLVHLDKRLPIDEAAFAKEKDKVAEELGRQKGGAIFMDWLRERRKAAKLQPVGRS
jgi:peptidyl-prolyl cis-trans isomerase D